MQCDEGKIEWRYCSFCSLLSLLRYFLPIIRQVEHDVAGQGVADGLGASLPVDKEIGRRELMEDVETFETGNEVASSFLSERIEKRTGDAGVPHEVVGVHRLVTITTTRVHLDVGGNAEALQPMMGVTLGIVLYVVVGSKTILEIDGVDGSDGAFLVIGMTILYVSRQAKREIADGIVKGETVF